MIHHLRFLLLALLFTVGCRRDPVVGPVPVKKVTQADDDKVPIVLDIFRQGGEVSSYREALSLLGTNLTKPDVQERLMLSADQRQLLERQGGLTPADFKEIEAMEFKGLDAHHVESRVFFRDAARALEVSGMPELDQATFVLDWVNRHVLLHEQQNETLPAAYVLRAGFGGTGDRALVFLNLLAQMQMTGCVLAVPGQAEPILVGVLHHKKVYLFDPRLGKPIAGPGGKGIATWDDARKQPVLLKESGIAADMESKLEPRLPVSLEALSPRMSYLEGLLQGKESHIGSEQIVLAADLSGRIRDFEAAGLKNVMLAIPGRDVPAPLRGLRELLPPDEGGSDPTGRWKRFTFNLVPWPPIVDHYQRLRIFSELPTPARDMLLHLTAELFDRYYKRPQEMLVRGKSETLPRRLDRIRTVVEDSEFANPAEEAELIKAAATWRERVNQAYLAALRQEPEGAARVKSIWDEDQYLMYLLQPDLEEMPRGAAKKDLSRLILSASREALGSRANLMFAALSQDKAERTDAVLRQQLAAGKEGKSTQVNARNAWLNARSAWVKYLDRNNLGVAILPTSLAGIRLSLERGDADRALTQWEYLHLELHNNFNARLQLARAMARTGQSPGPTLDALAKDLDSLISDEKLAKFRQESFASPLFRAPVLRKRIDLLNHDWGTAGHFTDLRQRVDIARKTES